MGLLNGFEMNLFLIVLVWGYCLIVKGDYYNIFNGVNFLLCFVFLYDVNGIIFDLMFLFVEDCKLFGVMMNFNY